MKPHHTRAVIAHNDAADSGNPMHDDDAARAMGYKAALVPGVTVFGYMTRNLIDHYGERWLESGAMRVRFRQPVFAGERLEITSGVVSEASTTKPAGDEINIEVHNPENEVCVVGTGSMDPTSEWVHASSHRLSTRAFPPARALPNPKWPAEYQQFNEQKILGEIVAQFAHSDAGAFCAAMQDDLDIYQRAVHPAWLLRQANIIVDQNFAVGAWIHTESEVQFLARAPYDTPLHVRAEVLALHDKKSHQYADLDVVMLAEGDTAKPVMRVMHRAIYKIN